MNAFTQDQIRQNVRGRYKAVALQDSPTSCCSADSSGGSCEANSASAKLGYSNDELTSVPEGADMGLGCGNPQTIASLRQGEVVLDLGSGGGFDCFLAARQIGEQGLAIGVDMTPEMVSKARANAEKGGYSNTDFRLGEIEHLPVADATVDVIISNCVINLSPDKPQVFRDAYRVLKQGGRLAISDVVMTAALPDEMMDQFDQLYSGCVGGASSIEDLRLMLEQSGFTDIRIEPKNESKAFIQDWVPNSSIEDYIVSAVVQAVKD